MQWDVESINTHNLGFQSVEAKTPGFKAGEMPWMIQVQVTPKEAQSSGQPSKTSDSQEEAFTSEEDDDPLPAEINERPDGKEDDVLSFNQDTFVQRSNPSDGSIFSLSENPDTPAQADQPEKTVPGDGSVNNPGAASSNSVSNNDSDNNIENNSSDSAGDFSLFKKDPEDENKSDMDSQDRKEAKEDQQENEQQDSSNPSLDDPSVSLQSRLDAQDSKDSESPAAKDLTTMSAHSLKWLHGSGSSTVQGNHITANPDSDNTNIANVTAQLDFSFGGSEPAPAGTIVIKLPLNIFKTRQGTPLLHLEKHRSQPIRQKRSRTRRQINHPI